MPVIIKDKITNQEIEYRNEIFVKLFNSELRQLQEIVCEQEGELNFQELFDEVEYYWNTYSPNANYQLEYLSERIYLARAMKPRLEKRLGLELNFIDTKIGYEVDKTYYCSYWNKLFKVLEVINDGIQYVRVQWLDDNRIASHCTQLSVEDFEVINQK